MKQNILTVVFLAFLSVAHAQTNAFQQPDIGVTNWTPAPKWEQSSLLGNGDMSAAIFGHPHNERMIISQANIYLPTTMPLKPIDQHSRLDEIRKLILEGNGTDAAKIPVEQAAKEKYPGMIWNDPFIPAMQLFIRTSPQNIEKYQRSVNYQTGEATVSWKQNGKVYQRKQFISRADSLMLIEITAEEAFDSEWELKQQTVAWNQWDHINKHVKSTAISSEGKQLSYKCFFTKQWKPNIIGYEGLGKIISTDGQIETKGNSLFVKGASKVLFGLNVSPVWFDEKSKTDAIEKLFSSIKADYSSLLAKHVKVHGELFDRVKLELNGDKEDAKLFGDVMMGQAKWNVNPTFIQKQFYAARYNILSATGTQPPNLQGIWGYEWQPPWASDYTHDGNLPVAMSSMLNANMPELMECFFDYHDARLPYYRDNAKRLYGCRGIQIPSHTSSHGWNVHFNDIYCLSFWNGGAAWTAHFYYDYYLYTKNKKFLAKRAYPFMKEAALFYEDFMTVGADGKYVFNPSYSPENHPTNNPSQATINATMDVALAKELFRDIIAAAKILKEDKKQIKQWEAMLAKLPAYELDKNGDFREWIWKDYEERHTHRHISQLYGMYDRIDPEIAADAKLWAGVKKTVEERMKVRRQDGGGIMVFGLAQMAWVAANLGDEALTDDIIGWLSSQYWSNSLATYHDPNGLFNMDLSGGFQSVVIRTLLYSDDGLVHLLPAKPKSWQKGSISGIKARGRISVNRIAWNSGETQAELVSAVNQKVTLKLPKGAKSLSVDGKKVKIDAKSNSASLKMKAGVVIKVLVN